MVRESIPRIVALSRVTYRKMIQLLKRAKI